MCGICGLVFADPARPAPPGALERMSRAIAHRGPDDHGAFAEPEPHLLRIRQGPVEIQRRLSRGLDALGASLASAPGPRRDASRIPSCLDREVASRRQTGAGHETSTLDWPCARPSAIALAASPAVAQTKLLRFPDIHGDRVVFCYAGDLWLAPAGGGHATRLTAHPGLELFPKFSPDDEWIAFTGQYDGDEQVYVVPASGGAPRRLTFYPARGPLTPRWGYDNQVYGWTRDGKSVLFRSMMDNWNQGETRLYTVALAGGLPVALPMPVSGAGDFSADEKQVVYNPTARDFRTWKRYSGVGRRISTSS